jgi:hypothetical protein
MQDIAQLEDGIKRLLFNLTVGKLITSLIGILIVAGLTHFFQKSLSRYIQGFRHPLIFSNRNWHTSCTFFHSK